MSAGQDGCLFSRACNIVRVSCLVRLKIDQDDAESFWIQRTYAYTIAMKPHTTTYYRVQVTYNRLSPVF